MPKRHYWWKVEDLETNGLIDMLASDEAHRMEFDPKTGNITVFDADGEPCGEYNESHFCPPDCD